MSNEQYLGATIKAWAKFEGGVRFDDVVSISATFALNSIPTASLVVAVGQAGETPAGGRQTATIHKAKQKIKPRTKAEVYVTIEDVVGNAAEVKVLKPGTYKVFDGYVAGMGYQRSNNHANYVIHLVHWLDDLNNSSAINGNWFPGVPHDLAQQALFDRIGANGEVATAVMIPAIARELTSYSNITNDLWKNVIKPLFARIAGFAGDAEQNRYSGGTIPTKNDAAYDALKKMPGEGPYVPLGLKLSAGGINVENSIAQFFAQTIGSSFAQNTLWAKLISEYASQFLFAISPAVEWATPIPFCAGLKFGFSSTEITAKEYNYANFNSNMSQLIEAVYVHYPSGSNTNVPSTPTHQNAKLSYYKPWASFPKKPQKGLKLFKNPPAWLANLDAATIAALNSALYAQDGISDRPGAGAMPPGVDNAGKAIKSQEGTIDNFAKHWYYTEVLQQRYGEMAGPLRFDIAPGSIVKIHTPEAEKLLGDTNPFVVAAVISVSFVINSERASAGTSFTIAHIKTKAEEEDPLYATDTPPMYDLPWPGGPLAKAK